MKTQKETTERFRKEGSKLFEYSPEHRAYVFVYRNDRLKSLKALINAYLNQENND